MLLEFSVLNYSSFRERAVLSLLPAALKGKSPEVDHRAQFLMADGRKVLKSAVLYGPNASGKSNLLGALACMRSLVVNSAREGQAGDGLGVEPFRLSTTTLDQPSEFEIVFV
ncbi:MAG TPA: AAA family ATPase, partial [Myxococcota bacterium]|nr:AAA family ATPase [Myxococcota bacterium]